MTTTIKNKAYCIVLYCIVLYCIVLYCIVLYCIVLYCIIVLYITINNSNIMLSGGHVKTNGCPCLVYIVAAWFDS